MKYIIVCSTAAVVLMAVNACDKTPEKTEQRTATAKTVQDNKTEKPAEAAFSITPTKLANIPTGYEMGEALFSADGRHVAFVAVKDGKTFVYLDSRKGPALDGARDLVFRKDGNGFAYVANRDGKECVIIDGDEGELYDEVGRPFFAPDGSVFYEARRKEKWRIIAGKRERVLVNSLSPAPVISSDGKRLAYREQHGVTRKSYLRICVLGSDVCHTGKEYDTISELISDLSRSRLAYIAGKKGKKAVVSVDLGRTDLIEKEEAWYDEIALLRISGGGDHLAYLAALENNTVMVKDGAEVLIGHHDVAFELVVNDQGRTLHSAMVQGIVRAFIDGKMTGGKYDSGIEALTLSADGANYAFIAEKDNQYSVVVSGKEAKAIDKAVTPKFTPDGRKVVYRARNMGERFVVVADLQGRTIREHPHYEAVWDVSFSPDGKYVGYGVKAGNELWWKVEKL